MSHRLYLLCRRYLQQETPLALVAGNVGKEDASASPVDGDDRPSSAGAEILDATLDDHF